MIKKELKHMLFLGNWKFFQKLVNGVSELIKRGDNLMRLKVKGIILDMPICICAPRANKITSKNVKFWKNHWFEFLHFLNIDNDMMWKNYLIGHKELKDSIILFQVKSFINLINLYLNSLDNFK